MNAATAQNMNETIHVNTSRFGAIEVELDRVITLTTPLLGFPDSSRFVLRPHSQDSPFMWLQSLDDPKLAFVVIQAASLLTEYNPSLPTPCREELQLNGSRPHDLLLLLTIPEGKPQDMTANLLGPLVINPTARLATQLLLDPAIYDPCWPVFSKEEDSANKG